MAGFFFNNPDGTRQFDSNAWPCFGVVSRVVVPSSAPAYGSDLPVAFAKEYTFSITGVAPLIALKVPGALHPTTGNPRKAAGLAKATRSGSTWTFTIWIFSQINEWGFTYYVLDGMPAANVSGGLTYWDEMGGVVFSSELPYASIVTSTVGGRAYAAVAYASARMQDEFIDDFNNPYVIWSVEGDGVYDLGAGPVRGSIAIDGGTQSGTVGPTYPGAGHDRWSGFSFADLIVDVTDADGGLVDDYSLNPIDWPNASGTTVNPTLTFSSVQRSAAGINRDVSLTISATLSGNLSASTLRLMSTTRGELGAWTTTGAQNLVVQPNETLYFSMESSTSAGVRTGAWAIDILNASNANAAVDSLTLTATVDSDNNHNIANYNIDPWTWDDRTVSTTAFYGGAGDMPNRTVAGPNQTVTIRLTVSGLTGNMSAIGVYLTKNGSTAGSFEAVGSPTGSATTTVVAGDVISVMTDFQTYSGVRTAQYTVNLHNHTTGALISSFQVNATVDSDNDYNVTDVTPDAVDWTNITVGPTAENGLTFSNDWQTISGVNQTLNLRARITAFSGNAAQLWAEVHLYRAGTGGAVGTIPFGLNNQTTWSATNGQQFFFGGYVVSADAGHQTGSLTVTIYNDSDGGAVLDTFTIGWNIDTDNSSLPPDYTPDAFGFTNQSQSTASEYLMLASGWKTVSGITAPITIRATITGITGNIQAWMRGLYMWRNSGHYQYTDWDAGDYVEMEFTNGQQIAINADANTDDGTRSGAVTFALTNQTTGASLGSYTCSFTVDSDNSSAPADYTLNGFAPANASTSTNAMSTTLGSSTYGVSGINRTVTLRYRITSVWKGGAGIYSDTGDVGLWLNGTNVAWFGGHTVGATMTVDVVNGDSLGIAAWAAIDVGGGPAEVVIGIAIDNLSTGVNDIGSCSVSYTLDADGNGA